MTSTRIIYNYFYSLLHNIIILYSMSNCGTCSMQQYTVSHLLVHSCVQHLETGHGHMIYDKLI